MFAHVSAGCENTLAGLRMESLALSCPTCAHMCTEAALTTPCLPPPRALPYPCSNEGSWEKRLRRARWRS